MITDGELSLVPPGLDVDPLYLVQVVAGPVCDADHPPAPGAVVMADGGRWSASSTTVRFTSNAGASPTGAVDLTGPAPAVIMSLAGHQYQFHRVRLPHYTAAYLFVSVVNQAEHPVDGAVLAFRTSDGLVAGGVTNAGRPFGTSGPPGSGSVRVWVTPPAGYSVAATQPNPIDVPTTGGQTTTIVLHLVANGGS